GLSVSDQRDALALVLDGSGRPERRLDLPRGAGERGDEAMNVVVSEAGALAISGMLDGPGTHAEVRSNGFLDVRAAEDVGRQQAGDPAAGVRLPPTRPAGLSDRFSLGEFRSGGWGRRRGRASRWRGARSGAAQRVAAAAAPAAGGPSR